MKPVKLIPVFYIVFLASGPAVLSASEDEIIVTATRSEKQPESIAAAVTVVGQADIQTGRQQLGLDEALNRIPGLFFQNRYNFSQDLRVSIRGFGTRANFGIRGIKVLVDELPSTLADGQSNVDDIDMGSVGRIEVLRGPASSLYGSAAGGVLSLHTEEGTATPFAEAGLLFGEFAQQKYQLKAGGEYGKLNYLLNASHLAMEGYREHAQVEHSLFNSKFRYAINATSALTVIVNAIDSPVAKDPGALNAAAVLADRRQAQARNLSSNAGEELAQQKLGLVFKKSFRKKHQISLRNYYIWRDFETFLPIGTHIPITPDDGVVAFDRLFFGGGGQYTYAGTLFGRPNRLMIGFDIDRQEDRRQRFLNNAGVAGALSFAQQEEADSRGLYIRNEFAWSDTLEFSVGGRYDSLALSVKDQFLTNGDQSSRLDFDEFSPTVGILWRLFDVLHLYANYAASFETPTFTELANPARNLNVNLGGFNLVQAQTADSVELGLKVSLGERIYFDLAVFTMQVEGEISSMSNIGNRSFFENADTMRQGIEAMLIMDMPGNLQLSSAYTCSDFRFDRFVSNPVLEGNALPGIPPHQFYIELAWRHDSGGYLIWDMLVVDDFFVNNANSAKNPAYQVSNLRMGHEFSSGRLRFSSYLGINNLLDEQYNANARLNAFGGHFFEPAPGRHIYGGLAIRYAY